MTAYTRHRIRIAPDIKSHVPVMDNLSGSDPIIWRGTSVQVEVGLLCAGALQTDISNIAALYLEIHDSSRIDGPLVQKSISNLAVNLTSEQWASGDSSKCHALFDLTYSETQLPLAPDTVLQQKRTFWMVVHAVTTDLPDFCRLTWGACNLVVEEDGAQNEIGSVPQYAPAVRVSNGTLQLYNRTTGLFHPVWMEGNPGVETIKWGEGLS